LEENCLIVLCFKVLLRWALKAKILLGFNWIGVIVCLWRSSPWHVICNAIADLQNFHRCGLKCFIFYSFSACKVSLKSLCPAVELSSRHAKQRMLTSVYHGLIWFSCNAIIMNQSFWVHAEHWNINLLMLFNSHTYQPH